MWLSGWKFRKKHVINGKVKKGNRFYIPTGSSAAPADVTPIFGAWDKISFPAIMKTDIYKVGVGSAGTVTQSENVSTSPYDVLCMQLVSDPIAAQTINGTVKGQIRVRETNALADFCTAVIIKVVSNDGSILRGTLLTYKPASLTSEFATDLTNRFCPPSTAVTPVTAQDGDRIVIEIGFRSFNTSTSNYSSLFSVGDVSDTDLGEDETDTSVFNPWIEFSQTIIFQMPVNYSMKFVANYGSGSDSGDDVYLNNNCRTDFGDIRITKADGETLLPYWIQDKVDGNYAIFWVNLTDTLIDEVVIYIYYGNPSATTLSNGNNTFLFFDHFDVDLSKWTLMQGDVEILNSELILTSTSGTTGLIEAITTSFGPKTCFGFRIKASDRTPNLVSFGARATGSWTVNSIHMRGTTTTDRWDCRTFRASSLSTYGGIFSDISVYCVYELRWLLSKVEFIQDGTVYFTNTGLITTVNTLLPAFEEGTTVGDTVSVDWVFARHFLQDEPTNGEWGIEEKASQLAGSVVPLLCVVEVF